jgi:spore maturation protein CgeB
MPARLLSAARAFKPNLIFIAKGELVPGDTIRALKDDLRCPAVNWFPDGRLFSYSNVMQQLPHLDFLFSKNLIDLERMRLLGIRNGRFLLHCADRELHTELVTTDSELKPYLCQVAVVGSYYPFRDYIISQLLDFDIRIWGPGWQRSMVSKKRGAIVGREARSSEQAKVFRAATINVNPHHFDDIGSLNQRVFDICGSGGCQLLDGYRKVDDVFAVPDDVDLFHSAEELRDKVRKLIASPERAREMGKHAREKTAAAHTYDHRIAEIFQLLNDELRM